MPETNLKLFIFEDGVGVVALVILGSVIPNPLDKARATQPKARLMRPEVLPILWTKDTPI